LISNKKFGVASSAVDVGENAMGCDLISTTIHNQVNGAQLTDYEVFAMIALVLLVGRGTIVNFLPFAMEYLARHPRDFAQLSANPQKIPQQVAKNAPPLSAGRAGAACHKGSLARRCGTQISRHGAGSLNPVRRQRTRKS
jgi:hypothetical protein